MNTFSELFYISNVIHFNKILILHLQELCAKGGVLFLAQSILSFKIKPPFSEFSTAVAAVSRLKAKVLSIVSPVIECINGYPCQPELSHGILILLDSFQLRSEFIM